MYVYMYIYVVPPPPPSGMWRTSVRAQTCLARCCNLEIRRRSLIVKKRLSPGHMRGPIHEP